MDSCCRMRFAGTLSGFAQWRCRREQRWSSLVCVVGLGALLWGSLGLSVQAAPKGGWEYKTLYRDRDFVQGAATLLSPGSISRTAWRVSEDSAPAVAVDIDAKLQELGSKGWELVTITPRVSGATSNGYAPLTTEELWIFKRAK